MRHNSLNMFFRPEPEFEFLSNILRMVCMVILSGLSLTSCVIRRGDRGTALHFAISQPAQEFITKTPASG